MARYSHPRHDTCGDGWRLFSLFLGLILVGEFGCGETPVETPKHSGGSSCPDPIIGGRYTRDIRSGVSPSVPPISGGTLLATKDDATLAAADADRDSVWLVDTKLHTLRARVQLPAGSEPGRLVEDQDGQLHVVLRRGGQLAKIDPMTGAITLMRAVCAAPRGVAYDAATDNLHVVCAGGELVTLKARGGAVLRSLFIDWDLRDVVMRGDHLMVSRFRSAQLLEIDASGTLLGRVKPPPGPASRSLGVPNTAWRLHALPDGRVLMLHQMSSNAVLRGGVLWGIPPPIQHGTYRDCGQWYPWQEAQAYAVTVFNNAINGESNYGLIGIYDRESLIVDIALSRSAQELVFVNADAQTSKKMSNRISWIALEHLVGGFFIDSDDRVFAPLPLVDARLVAAAYDGLGQLWSQSVEPPAIYWGKLGEDRQAHQIDLPTTEDRSDFGRRLFYERTDSQLACASCHPEAGDDGQIWFLQSPEARRTQSLRGGLLATAPFHWSGQVADMKQLMQTTFVDHMGAAPFLGGEIEAISKWLDAQPSLPKSPPRDPAAASRGQALFERASVGCTSCHNGPRYTNNLNKDVGAGQAFQVPSLTDLAFRAPYMHDGCASTLHDLFNPTCGGNKHGYTSQLTPAQLDDLVAYLETL